MQLGIQLDLLTGTGELDDRLNERLLLSAIGIEEERG
jgi:hypothetical protein